MNNFYKGLVLAVFFAAITAIAGLLHGVPWTITTSRELLLGIGSFGCFGFLLGGIHAFDSRSELSIKPSPVGRMFFGLIASMLLAVMWRWLREGVALAALIGVLLGYLGMKWAQYADF